MQKSLPYDSCKYNKLIECTNRDPDKCGRCAWCPEADEKMRKKRVEQVLKKCGTRKREEGEDVNHA